MTRAQPSKLPLLCFALRTLVLALTVASAATTAGCASTSTLIAVGTPAPDFAAPDEHGVVRTRADYAGKPLVMFFYPKDGSPGCTKEACAFRNVWSQYDAAGAVVVGVSTDSVDAHQAFIAEHKLPFSLLSDGEEKLMKAYGVDSTFGLAARVTVLVDKDGTVVRVWPNVDPGVHAAEVLAALPPSPPPPSPSPSLSPPSSSSP